MNNLIKYMRSNRSLLVLHGTVFIWGFTGLLGALISIPAIYLVWYRVLIAFLTLLIWFKASKRSLKISLNGFIKLFLTGAVLASHWILFFHSIKVSTVAVTLVCLSSITLFTSILEPLINRTKIALFEVVTGLMIIAGIYLIFEFESRYTLGILTGISSALCASIFSIINSRQVKKIQPTLISFYELLSGWVWISIYLLLFDTSFTTNLPTISDVGYLLVLGVLCTAIAYAAGVSVMKELSAFRVALITNLEPLYGMLLAILFLGKKEVMSPGFYAGSVIILGSIFLYPAIKNRIKKSM